MTESCCHALPLTVIDTGDDKIDWGVTSQIEFSDDVNQKLTGERTEQNPNYHRIKTKRNQMQTTIKGNQIKDPIKEQKTGASLSRAQRGGRKWEKETAGEGQNIFLYNIENRWRKKKSIE